MKALLGIILFSALTTSLSPMAFADEINYRDYADLKRFAASIMGERSLIAQQVKETEAHIPKTFSEKLYNLKSGTDEKTINCINIRRYSDMQERRINATMQEHTKKGVYKRMSYQRFQEFDYRINEFKKSLMKARKECHDFEDSAYYLKQAMNDLVSVNEILTVGFTLNNSI